jgi:hypothetical protein
VLLAVAIPSAGVAVALVSWIEFRPFEDVVVTVAIMTPFTMLIAVIGKQTSAGRWKWFIKRPVDQTRMSDKD